MQTIKINLKKIEKEKLISVINLLKQGRVIIFPTDTVYSLVADATNRKAVKKVFQIKQRSPKNPIPIFVKNIEAAKKIVMPQATLCVIEQGKLAPGMDTINRIARAYGVLAVFGDGGPVFRPLPES